MLQANVVITIWIHNNWALHSLFQIENSTAGFHVNEIYVCMCQICIFFKFLTHSCQCWGQIFVNLNKSGIHTTNTQISIEWGIKRCCIFHSFEIMRVWLSTTSWLSSLSGTIYCKLWRHFFENCRVSWCLPSLFWTS